MKDKELRKALVKHNILFDAECLDIAGVATDRAKRDHEDLRELCVKMHQLLTYLGLEYIPHGRIQQIKKEAK